VALESQRSGQPGRLMMPLPVTYLVAIDRVAEMLGEAEEFLFEIACDMAPEDGCLNVYGVDNEFTVAFTPQGIDRLTELIPKYKKPRLCPGSFAN
jgi:hypothetical protein